MSLDLPTSADAPRTRDDYLRLQERCGYLEAANERLSTTVAEQAVEITRLRLQLLRLQPDAA